MRQTVPSLLPIFRSEDQLRMLGLVVLEPAREWTLDDLAASTGMPRPSVHRELQRALSAGLVDRDATRRPHRSRPATDGPLYEPLRLLLERTIGIEEELRGVLDGRDGVELAVIHGSWARGEARP